VTSDKKWEAVYDDGILKIKRSLLDLRYYVYIDDEYRKILEFGDAWKLGTVLLEIAEGYYVVLKKVKKNGKVYTYDQYILKPRGAALRDFNQAMAGHVRTAKEIVASKVGSNLPTGNTS